MLTEKDKEFFASVMCSAGKLSDCDQRHGAVIVGRPGILHYGCNRKLTKDQELSAISEVIFNIAGQRLKDLILFSTKFPDLSDMKMILSAEFNIVYFFGEITDPDSVRLVNDWNATASKPLEIIRLQIEPSQI
jgi:hypothetical protein